MITSEMNLIEEFWQKFDSCYVVYNQKIPKRFYLFYDEKFIRQKKLSRVLLQEVQYPTEIVGKCLFRLDLNHNYLDIVHKIYEPFFIHNKYDKNNTKKFMSRMFQKRYLKSELVILSRIYIDCDIFDQFDSAGIVTGNYNKTNYVVAQKDLKTLILESNL
jgi:hypothetical protein